MIPSEIFKTFGIGFLQYILSPAIVALIFLWGVKKTYKIGQLAKEHQDMVVDNDEFKKSLSDIRDAIVEIQTILALKFGKVEIKHILKHYGESHSPIALKKEFRDFVTESHLDTHIAEKKKALVAWLKKQEPKTGLDAQDEIIALVASGQIEDYLNLTEYKQYVYEHGELSEGADGILAIYLFEVLIPALGISSGEHMQVAK